MVTTRLRISFLLTVGTVVVLIGILLAQGFAASGTAAPTPATARTIAAQGHGEVAVVPDQASITMGVESRAKEARVSLANNTAKMKTVIAAIKRQGVLDKHLQTTELSLWYDSNNANYVATHRLTIRLDRIDKLGTVLDAAVRAGANSSWGVNYGVKDSSAARAKALKRAVADALKHAQSIGRALGLSIGSATAANETTFGYTPQGMGGGGGGGGASIQPGQLVVTADVTVTYTAN